MSADCELCGDKTNPRKETDRDPTHPADSGGITIEWRDQPPIDDVVAVLDRLVKLHGEDRGR